MANCEQYWDLISYSLDGALTEEEQRRLDRHLAQCPQCRAMWEQLSGLEPELMELEAPPADFADRVMAAAQQVGGSVHRQPVEPGGKPGVHAEFGQRFPGGQKGLLGRVLRVLGPRYHPQGQGVDQALIALHQHPEGILLAPLGAHYQHLFLGAVIGSHHTTSFSGLSGPGAWP